MDWNDLIKIFLAKNSQINLSAIRDEKWVQVKHIDDSIELNKFLEIEKWSTVLDIGTGSGFPLMPLAMTNPDVQFVWIDSVRKKVKAVNEIIEEVWINNAKVIWGRVEELKDQKYDVIVARAVWYIDKLISWSYKLLREGWYFVFYKQINEEERKELVRICKLKKMKLIKEYEYKFSVEDIERVIYVVKKI
jgi:16S rRNA (guanine527-N7)-methyltransferase